MRRSIRVIGAVIAGVAFALALAGCGAKSAGGAASSWVADPSLDQYLTAKTLTADFTLTSSDGFEATGTVWVEGRKFRYSLWVKGVLLRSIMSPDGKTAYFVEEKGKYSEPSVASVDRYLLEFSKPATGSVQGGVDATSGATMVVYPVKQLDNLAGAANGWYTEDITYLVKNGSVIGTLTRGDTAKKAGEKYDLRTSRRMFTNLKADAPIPPGTFDLPYPIKAAK
jgi:hypothetical protein